MKTVLIADDDYMARQKLRGIMVWEQYGYTISGEAANGKEALDLIREQTPDIALVDMDMPVLNGVELIRKMKELKLPISVIVLSSYNDFDYVRDSMKLGALDYILKSELNKKQLLGTLSCANTGQDQETRQGFSDQDEVYIQELYVRKILLGLLKEGEQGGELIERYQLPIDKSRNMLAVCELDDYYLAVEKMDEKGIFTFHQFIEHLWKEAALKVPEIFPVKIEDRRYCLVLSCRSILSIGNAQRLMESVLSEIRSNMLRFLNMTISISISSICLSLTELSDYYRKSEQRLKNKFYLGKNAVIHVSEEAVPNRDGGGQETQICFGVEQEKEMLFLFSIGDVSGLTEKIRDIFLQMERSRKEESQARTLIIELLGVIRTVAKRNGADFQLLCEIEEPFHRVKQYETLKDLENWILDICYRLCEQTAQREKQKNYNRLTVNAVFYIDHNYARPISLSDAAEYLQVSSSYLSRIFKNDTGMNFVNYLNQVRIDKARSMLEGQPVRQIKSIARETGFNNYNHFFTVFKSIVGMSPVEYQERER
ncbi:response regulator transcription factor [Diplocloster modestus]|uniref:Stage 0 sporulation protein A homolog n=1 Tax=Diplocloster modestus TaxID=2850322 RepID=A0ABS6KBH7_9FIRM|nr:response regulator [Diplocloster modestus]MBU9727861.1 response regulator [Diplocloster modestus]